jgi:hypothetical protein
VAGELIHGDLLDSGRVDEHAGDGGDSGQVEAGEVVSLGETVERRVEVGPGVFATMSMRPIWNSYPSAYRERDASRLR